MLKNKVLFVGVGQCGSNIAKEMEMLGYSAFYINTSVSDLNTIESIDELKFHIPSAVGCAKDRDKAKAYVRKYYERITQAILSKFGSFTKIFFCFSASGGTGSGISPILINTMSNQAPHLTIGAICVLPHDSESTRAKYNAVTCYQEITKIKLLKNTYFLDNNNGDIFEINKKFGYCMDKILNLTTEDTRGIIDEQEVETLLEVEGNVVFANIEEVMSQDVQTEDILYVSMDCNGVIHNSCFTNYEKGSKYIAYSLNTETTINKAVVEEAFGRPIDDFVGYNEGKTFVVAFGLPFPKNRIEELVNRYDEEKEKIVGLNNNMCETKIEIGNFFATKKDTNISLSKKLSDLLSEF